MTSSHEKISVEPEVAASPSEPEVVGINDNFVVKQFVNPGETRSYDDSEYMNFGLSGQDDADKSPSGIGRLQRGAMAVTLEDNGKTKLAYIEAGLMINPDVLGGRPYDVAALKFTVGGQLVVIQRGTDGSLSEGIVKGVVIRAQKFEPNRGTGVDRTIDVDTSRRVITQFDRVHLTLCDRAEEFGYIDRGLAKDDATQADFSV